MVGNVIAFCFLAVARAVAVSHTSMRASSRFRISTIVATEKLDSIIANRSYWVVR
jgi:hypothetical protein